MVSLAIKTKQTNLIAKLYYLLIEADSRHKVTDKALPEGIDWKPIIKECADNGHPIVMLIHAYNLGKANKDYKKYITQADEMGVARLIPNCIRYCKNKKKWLALDAELKEIDTDAANLKKEKEKNYMPIEEIEFIVVR